MSNSEYTGSEVAIVGMACRFPDADNVQQFWSNLINEKEAITFFDKEECKRKGISSELYENENFVRTYGGLLSGKKYFDHGFFNFTKDEAKILDPQIRQSLECIWEAMEDGGFDPINYKKRIGLFFGASDNFYWQGMTLFQDMQGKVEDFWAAQLRNKDNLSTHVAYKLDFKGPSVNLNTACSSSLVAIHMACQSLLNGEAEMAVSGGVSIPANELNGYLYREGLVLSKDGHCRAFDKDSSGTIPGEGVGVVVLKLLEDAIRDKDNIYAVVKGSFINNDGSRKVGYTAPSTEGQVEAVKNALYYAEVEPDTISYVEAHGTGTKLGDPIELESLSKAFASSKQAFCGVGSVKTNIGHLDAAAGVAGFIKTALILKNKVIPASLHFKNPNPAIKFENTPFYVSDKLTHLNGDKSVHRACVNSLGIGGTNAFVVLEEAPKQLDLKNTQNEHILLFSSKKQESLATIQQDLLEQLKANPQYNLESIAYTLQLGRNHMPYRSFVTCTNIDDAYQKISRTISEKRFKKVSKLNPSYVYLFPGQGSQYVNMFKDLYTSIKLIKESVDFGFAEAEKHLNIKLNDVVFSDNDNSEKNNNINNTLYAQPILFIFQYALAKYLSRLNVNPFALMGHSLGEYVAACIAEVFSFEEGIEIICRRAELMGSCQPGKMVAVSGLSAEKVSELINNSISIAVVNSYDDIVVSGDTDSVDTFCKQLEDKAISFSILKTSHGYHSLTMEPILNEYTEFLKKFTFNIPKIRFISNVSGNWIKPDEAISPIYWAKHLRETVQFDAGLQKILNVPDAIFIEIGPGNTLVNLLKKQQGFSNEVSMSMVRHKKQNFNDREYFLDKLGLLWSEGATISWEPLYEEQPYKVSLPTYPFSKDHCWLDHSLEDLMSMNQQISDKQKGNFKTWIYNQDWKRRPFEFKTNGNDENQKKKYCVFTSNSEIENQIVNELKNSINDIIEVGTTYKDYYKNGNSQINLDLSNTSHVSKLFEYLIEDSNLIVDFVYLNISNNGGDLNEYDKNSNEKSILNIVQLAKVIRNLKTNVKFNLNVISNNVFKVVGNELIMLDNWSLAGSLNVLSQELLNIHCKLFDINIQESNYFKTTIEKISSEIVLNDQSNDTTIAYRNGYRWLPDYSQEQLSESRISQRCLKNNATYLITGGLGNVGRLIARNLGVNYKSNVILLTRKKVSFNSNEDRYVIEGINATKQSEVDQLNQSIKQAGGDLFIYQADVSDFNQLAAIVGQVETNVGKINGVFHAAGVTDSETLFCPTEKVTKEALNVQNTAKIEGTLAIYKAFHNKDIDFCLLFSSLSVVLGGLGFTAYAAANAFMDGVSHYLNDSTNGKWISLNLDGWQVNQANSASYNPLVMQNNEGFELIEYVLKYAVSSNLIVSCTNLKSRLSDWINKESANEITDIESNVIVNKSKNEKPLISASFQAAENEIEMQLVDIWEDFFNFTGVGVNDNYYELGGDSLKAISIVSRIQNELNIQLALLDFFNNPTIGELSKLLLSDSANVKSNIPITESKEFYPLTSAQKRLFIIQQITPESVAYNQILLFKVKGNLDLIRLENAFKELIYRHEILRTAFKLINGEPVQIIRDKVDFSINQLKKLNGSHEDIRKIIKPFNLLYPPFIRATVSHQDNGEYILVMDMHHIVTDAISSQIIMDELVKLYFGEQLPEEIIQYKDFSSWQNSSVFIETIKKQKAYWKELFNTKYKELNLPTDFKRPEYQSYEGQQLSFSLAETTSKSLKQIAKDLNVSLFTLIATIFKIFLSKLSNQSEIVIGTPLIGRYNEDLFNTCGIFASALVLMSKLDSEKSIQLLVKEIHTNVLGAFDKQYYSFEDMVDEFLTNRDMSRNPIFNVMFAFQNAEKKIESFESAEFEDFNINVLEVDNQTSKFDLSLLCAEENNSIQCIFEYSTALFKQDTIERFIKYFENIINSIIQDPTQKLGELQFIGSIEIEKLLNFNASSVEPYSEISLYELIEKQFEMVPNAVAIVEQDLAITYNILEQRVNEIGLKLIENGVKKGEIVSIVADRHIEMICSALAVLKIGAAYLPTDLKLPDNRIEYMFNDCSIKHILSTNKIGNNFGRNVIDTSINSQTASVKEFPEINIRANDVAYIIYTSGSTGNPKAVAVEHKAAIQLIKAQNEKFNINGSDNVCQFSSFAFDASVEQIYLALTNGAKLYLAKPDEQINGGFENYIRKNQITHLHAVPSFLSLLDLKTLSSLKRLIAGGEVCNPELTNKIPEGCRFWNEYGPTETTVTAVEFEASDAEDDIKSLPIGKPLDGVKAYVLDNSKQLRPINTSGELYLSGGQLARGYLNNPEITNAVFLPDPFEPESLMYKTGDIVKWNFNGELEYFGRADNQVKLNGYRIELGEIEGTILKYPGVNNTCVVLTNKELIVGFYTGSNLNEKQLIAFLQNELPGYMVPSQLVQMDEFPLSVSGKPIKQKLIDHFNNLDLSNDVVLPENETEQNIYEIWHELLGHNRFGTESNFFSIGGSSLKAIRLVHMINIKLKLNISVIAIFQYITIKKLADFISKQQPTPELITSERTEVRETSQNTRERLLNKRLKQ